jgi:hypothetical protein
MVTYAPDTLEWLADEWEDAIASAVCSGIVGDAAHREKPSKHNSRTDNPSNSWATSHSKDQKGPSNMACAIDMSMSEADMKRVHNRLIALYNARGSDARAAYVDCFNGWNGSGSPGRYDLPAGTVSSATDDHKWHEHTESFYLYAGTDDQSWTAARAILSVVKGETEDQWHSGGDDMTPEEVQSAVWGTGAGQQVNYRIEAFMSLRPKSAQPNKDETNQLAAKLVAIEAKLDAVAGKVDIDPAELEAIEASAYAGAQAGAADVDAIAAAVVDAMNLQGLTEQQKADVEASAEQAVRDVLTGGTAGVPVDDPAP